MRCVFVALMVAGMVAGGCGGQQDKIRPYEITEHLTEDDAVTDENFYFDSFWFKALDTGTVRVDLKSSEFDPVVIVYDEDGHRLDRDDDGGSGDDARAGFTATFGKYYEIEATSHSAEEKGYYKLKVSPIIKYDSTITRRVRPVKEVSKP